MRVLRPERHIYRIEKQIGQGRTATVYRARREDSRGHSRQTVALKILKDKNAVSWLRQEFERLAEVRSRYCVRVLAWENLELGPALALEWIDGLTLYDLARRANLSPAMIDEIVAQTQEALKDLGAAGLFHGDLSPVNILIDLEGQVRVVDFGGIPREQNAITGTPEYMAPELWQGEPAGLASDLFALGLIEFDLRTSFRRLSSGSSAAPVSKSPLLHIEPALRTMTEDRPDSVRQQELAETVRAAYQPPPSEILTKTFRRARLSLAHGVHGLASFVLSALTATAPVAAQAPMTLKEDKACLRVRAVNWVWISLNGKEVGYGPIDLNGLVQGTHHLRWRTHRGEGETWLRLDEGPCQKLSDADFGGNGLNALASAATVGRAARGTKNGSHTNRNARIAR